MSKFLITKRSQNRVTGPIMVTTSPRKTCPSACPFRKTSDSDQAGLCYAEHGMLGGFLWTKLDDLLVGGSFQNGAIKVHSLEELCNSIRSLPKGTIWRHNQAGDLPTKDGETIDVAELDCLVAANDNKQGFTYTHFDVINNENNCEAVKSANDNGFTINLSANDLEHADQLSETNAGPVTVVVPASQTMNTLTPNGVKVVVCPARVRENVTCATCRLCARQRDFVIGFPALGRNQHKLKAANDNA